MFIDRMLERKKTKLISRFIRSISQFKYQHYNQLTGLRPTQLGTTHREAELQGHVVSSND